MPETIVSTVPISEWRGAQSIFASAFETRPSTTQDGISAARFAQVVAPRNPRLCKVKERGLYFLPTPLRDAPLIGKTLERALALGQPTVGIMRSAGHVIEGCALKLDLDGVSAEKLAAMCAHLQRIGVAYVIYSTHSQGLKLDIRARLILFLDIALPPDGYRRAAQGAAKLLLGASLDPSEGYLHQLAGTFVAHPNRVDQAFREVVLEGGCVSSHALMAAGSGGAPQVTNVGQQAHAPRELTDFDRQKATRALEWINADDFRTWTKTGMMIKALLPGEDGLAVWLNFSARANECAQRRNTERRYDPVSMWEGFAPVVTCDVALATLLALARDATAVIARREIVSGDLTERGQDALMYLGRMHPRLADEIAAEEVLA